MDTLGQVDTIGQVHHDRMGWVGHGGLDWLRSGRLATKGRIVHDCIWWIGDDGLGWPRLDGAVWTLQGGLAMMWRVWPRLGRLVATGLRGLAKAGWVGHVGVGWHDEAISFNGVSLGISFVLDKIGCSMLVRLSGSTPSLDHSFDGISIGISLDHTLAISFWYVLLVEPSSCNLHEGTLVFLIQGEV